jgi:hypothetical protein
MLITGLLNDGGDSYMLMMAFSMNLFFIFLCFIFVSILYLCSVQTNSGLVMLENQVTVGCIFPPTIALPQFLILTTSYLDVLTSDELTVCILHAKRTHESTKAASGLYVTCQALLTVT